MSKVPGKIDHLAISASAGSGKTFQLAHRYIRLLRLGVLPERIAALTFSRKAAGEIFDAIAKYLCDAASDTGKARETGARVGDGSATPADFIRILRAFIDGIHRNRIGTLDSFTVSILRAFPMELGISPELQLMDSGGADAAAVRNQVLAEVFSRRSISEADRKAFHDAFREATFGKEDKRLEALLSEFIVNYRDAYLAQPSGDAWGNAARIWPAGCAWLAPRGDVAADAAALLASVPEALPARFREAYSKCLELFVAHAASRELPARKPSLWKQMLNSGLPAGSLTLTYFKDELELDAEQCRRLRRVVSNVVGTEIHRQLRRTRGVWEVLNEFEKHYDRHRRAGRMTFADAQYLLTENGAAMGGRIATRNPGSADRLYIDFRLDCSLDHWMIDEFQDTSDLQWEVVRNLVDEVMQDNSGERSFFYVGDVKQAIHAWRGGNARLFDDLREHYGSRIRHEGLDCSYRSRPEIMETVNRVFGALPAEAVPPPVLERWEGVWREHKCAGEQARRKGYASLIILPNEKKERGGGGDAADDPRFSATAALLRELNPIERGLTAAVLVRKNDEGLALADYLRRACPGMPVTLDGRSFLADNPVVSVLLSLVSYAAHPGDVLALRHVQMSPLGSILAERGYDTGTLPRVLLDQIARQGFAGFARHWGEALTLEAGDSFGRQRLGELIAAATAWDAAGGGSCDDFVDGVRAMEIGDAGARPAVTVMNVHKSKGLEFDAVILPALDQKFGSRVSLASGRSDGRGAAWYLMLPNKDIAEADPVLKQARDAEVWDDGFEALCVLYVAMTRARNALYMITTEAAAAAKTGRKGADDADEAAADTMKSAAAILQARLKGDARPLGEGFAGAVIAWETGDPQWASREEPPGAAAAAEEAVAPMPAVTRAAARPGLRRREPSARDDIPRAAARLFERKARDIRDFGSAIHDLFQRVEWVETCDVEAAIRSWERQTLVDGPVRDDVRRQFRSCIEAAAVRELLARPAGDADLWREKRFEIVHGNELVAGVFDRVTVRKDAAGKPVSAVVIDYKSSLVEGDRDVDQLARDYAPQVELYREALERILGLPRERIEAALVFTRHGIVRWLHRSDTASAHMRDAGKNNRGGRRQ